MRILREGSRRSHGKTKIIDRKRSAIDDLKIKFSGVPDRNSRSTFHDYTVELDERELDQLVQERQRRFRRQICDRVVVLKDAENPEDDELLRELFDRYTRWCVASDHSRSKLPVADENPAQERS